MQAKAVLLYPGTYRHLPAPVTFSVITPQISAAGVEHLDTILSPITLSGDAARRGDFNCRKPRLPTHAIWMV
ncbi:hypothetical protein KCP71_17650 [Salmonella enterica subsp. enterica]|nr:hypothetical protein KCP71_17650 [Salmonella enterica subsp. enterica]